MYDTWAKILNDPVANQLVTMWCDIVGLIKDRGQLTAIGVGPVELFAMGGGYRAVISKLRNALVRKMLQSQGIDQAPRTAVPVPGGGKASQLSIIPNFSGEKGQKVDTWLQDYVSLCQAIDIDPKAFIHLKLSHTRPGADRIAPGTC